MQHYNTYSSHLKPILNQQLWVEIIRTNFATITLICALQECLHLSMKESEGGEKVRSGQPTSVWDGVAPGLGEPSDSARSVGRCLSPVGLSRTPLSLFLSGPGTSCLISCTVHGMYIGTALHPVLQNTPPKNMLSRDTWTTQCIIFLLENSWIRSCAEL